MTSVLCSYCGNSATLTTGEQLYPHRPDLHTLHFWQCAPCDAYVGCRADSDTPLGFLAKKDLREARRMAHEALDSLWKMRHYRKVDLYQLMAVRTGVRHLAEADIADCNRVLEFCAWMQKRRLRERDNRPFDYSLIAPMLQALQQSWPPKPTPPPTPKPMPKPTPAQQLKEAEAQRERRRERNRRKKQRKRERLLAQKAAQEGGTMEA